VTTVNEFIEALHEYRTALNHYLDLQRTPLSNEYFRAGRQARRELRRCRQLAAAQRIVWDCGDGARTFY